MSSMIRISNPGLRPSRLYLAIQGMLLASALTVSAATHAENINDYASVKHSYHISAGSLSQALRQFATNSGLLFSAEAKLTDGKTTAGLDGEYTVEEGFKKLLAGSGLTYSFTGEDSVAIRVLESGSDAASTLPAVRVVGKAVYDLAYPYNTQYNRINTTTATKTDTPIMETPVSIQTVTQQVIQDRKVTRVDKAVENVSGVYTNVGGGGLSDTFNVRGFRSYDTYRNGMRLQGTLSTVGKRETANLERIEVLKGPASLLYGRIETGGMVNMVTKQPLEETFYAVEQQFASFGTYRTTVDSTGPINSNKNLLYRVNMAYESSDSFREYIEGQRVFVAPVLTWKVSDKDEVTFEMEYFGNKGMTDMGTTAIGNRPVTIPRERNLGENGGGSESDDIVLGYNWKHAFNGNWKLNHRFNVEYTQMGDRGLNILPWGIDTTTGNLDRFSFGLRNNRTHTYSTDLNLTGRFATYGIEHTVLMGGDYYDFWNAGQEYDSSMIGVPCDGNSSFSGFPSINVFDPQHSSCGSMDAFNPNIYGFTPGSGDNYEIANKNYGLYAQDQIKLPFNIHLLGGMRYNWVEDSNFDNVYGPLSNSPDKGRWSRVKPRAGVVWQPINQISFYGNYMENFGVSSSVGGAGGYSAPPEESHQWETGVKTEWLDGRLTAGVALYQITKTNLTVGCGARCWETLGKVRNEGLELDVAGEVQPGWRVIGAYSYIDSEIIGGNNSGNRLSNVPYNGGSLWSTYEIQSGDLQGLKFGAGVVARGQREGGPANTYQLPGYATVNLLTSYAWKVGRSRLITQLNVDNLLDKTTYIDSDDSNNTPRINFGMPRSFVGSVRLEF